MSPYFMLLVYGLFATPDALRYVRNNQSIYNTILGTNVLKGSFGTCL